MLTPHLSDRPFGRKLSKLILIVAGNDGAIIIVDLASPRIDLISQVKSCQLEVAMHAADAAKSGTPPPQSGNCCGFRPWHWV